MGIEIKSIPQAKAELLNYLKKNDALSLIMDKDDMSDLFNAAAIMSDSLVSDIMSEELVAAITEKEIPLEGVKMTKKDDEEVSQMLSLITFSHPDVFFELKKGRYFFSHETCFMELFGFKRTKHGDLSIINFSMRLNYIKDLDSLKKICPQDLFNKKDWSVRKHENKSVIESSGWSKHQVVDLLEDRRIVNYGR